MLPEKVSIDRNENTMNSPTLSVIKDARITQNESRNKERDVDYETHCHADYWRHTHRTELRSHEINYYLITLTEVPTDVGRSITI